MYLLCVCELELLKIDVWVASTVTGSVNWESTSKYEVSLREYFMAVILQDTYVCNAHCIL